MFITPVVAFLVNAQWFRLPSKSVRVAAALMRSKFPLPSSPQSQYTFESLHGRWMFRFLRLRLSTASIQVLLAGRTDALPYIQNETVTSLVIELKKELFRLTY